MRLNPNGLPFGMPGDLVRLGQVGLVGALLLAGCGRSLDSEAEVAAAIKEAVFEFESYRFAEAYDLFQRARQAVSPPSDVWAEATYGAATAAWHSIPASEALVGRADELFAEIVARAPASRFAPYALRNQARLREIRDYPGDAPDPEAARPFYRAIIERWPEREIAHEATLRLGGTYIQKLDDEASVREGFAIYRQFIKENPGTAIASIMWEHMGETALNFLGDQELAFEGLRRAEAIGFIDRNKVATNYWRIAELAEDLDQPEVAVRYYQRIIAEHSRSGRAFESIQALQALRDAHPELEFEIPQIKVFGSERRAAALSDPQVSLPRQP